MKKIYKICLFTIVLLLLSCGSIHNKIEITIKATNNSKNIDSLKTSIIKMDGVTSVAICDSSLKIIIIYNRLENSDLNILENIKKYGYKYKITAKKRLEK